MYKYVRKQYDDERGCIYPGYKNKWMPSLNFVEDRFSYSHYGVVRGFHGDDKTTKLCMCIEGELKLVLWDLKNKIRADFTLREGDGVQILIPPYHLNAHQCLSDKCILYYKWTEPYSEPQWTVHCEDKRIGAYWDFEPLYLSERDRNGLRLEDLKI